MVYRAFGLKKIKRRVSTKLLKGSFSLDCMVLIVIDSSTGLEVRGVQIVDVSGIKAGSRGRSDDSVAVCLNFCISCWVIGFASGVTLTLGLLQFLPTSL